MSRPDNFRLREYQMISQRLKNLSSLVKVGNPVNKLDKDTLTLTATNAKYIQEELESIVALFHLEQEYGNKRKEGWYIQDNAAEYYAEKKLEERRNNPIFVEDDNWVWCEKELGWVHIK